MQKNAVESFARVRAFAAVVLSAAVLVGCGNNGGYGCLLFIPTLPGSLIYPMNGATNVPDGNFALVVAHAGAGYVLSLVGGGSAGVGLEPAPLPSPLPTPNASPSAAMQIDYAAYSMGSLTPNARYTLNAIRLPDPGCGSGSTTSIGSFTTR